MEKPKELLIIEPKNELHFVGPFTRPVMNIMKITNPTDNTILFKIKTTAPKRYCVRPNFGSIEPHSNCRIEICLQPFSYDPNDKNKHKFMVQSLVVPDKPLDDLNKLWKDAQPHQLMDVKLRCVFDMPAVTSAADSSGGSVNNESTKEVTSKSLPENKITTMDEEKVSNLVTPQQRQEWLNEMKMLNLENDELKAERRRLMDQLVKTRNTLSKPVYQQPPYTPILGEKEIPLFYIVLSIVTAIFGYIFGKYF